MTRADFHILPTTSQADRLSYACRLVEKAWRGGHSVYVHTDNATDADIIDNALWEIPRESFVPHALLPADCTLAAPERVHIGCSNDPGPHHDVLVNMGSCIPGFFSRFERVIEVVTQEPAMLQASRSNWKFYQERGYPLESHKIQKLPGNT